MRRVTDPEVLRKFNEMQPQLKKVQNPDVLKKYQEMQELNRPTMLEPGLLGFPQPETPRTLGGELTSAALALPGVNVARFLPQAGRLAKGLANAGGLIGQNAAIGGAANALDDESVGSGIVHGGAIGAGLAALPYAIPGAKKIFNTGKSIIGDVKNVLTEAKATPKQLEIPQREEFPQFKGIPPKELPQYNGIPPREVPQFKGVEPPKELPSTANPEANALLEKLGAGARTKEEASKRLAGHIMEGHAQRAAESGQFFEHPLTQVKESERLYEHVDPLISTKLDKEKDILGRLKDLKVGQLFDKFKAKPNFQNAHQLQSEIGAAIGDLKSNLSKTADDRATISNLTSVRNQLKTDIMDFLKRRDANSNENLAPMYQRGIDFYRENVEPYLSSRKLREIVRGGIETPKNIEKIFETPSSIRNPHTGEVKQAPQHKILQDLPEEAKDLILFNKIGATKHVNSADKLVDALTKAEKEGYQSYFNPELKEAIQNIAKRSESDIAREKAQKLSHAIATREAKNAYRVEKRKIGEEHKAAELEAKNAHKMNVEKIKEEHKAMERDAKYAHKIEERKYKEEYKSRVREIEEKNKAELDKKNEAIRKLQTAKRYGFTAALGTTGGAIGNYLVHKLLGGSE